MSDISTWHERAMAHPDHQSGMVSEDMIRARMCEEIADLRAEVERQRADAQAIAAIAHAGGTAGLSEREALVEIRRRTLKAWDRRTSREALEANPYRRRKEP